MTTAGAGTSGAAPPDGYDALAGGFASFFSERPGRAYGGGGGGLEGGGEYESFASAEAGGRGADRPKTSRGGGRW